MKAFLIVMMFAAPSHACPEARDDESARTFYQQAEEAYAAGRYDDALRAFSTALERSGQADLYFNLANTHERIGDRASAADALDRYLECAAPPDAVLVRERVRRLRDTVSLPPLSQPICTESTEPPEPILVTSSEEELDDAVGEPPRSATPWLIAGGASLLLAAGLAYASTTAGPEPACSDCRIDSARDWTPALQGGAVLAGAAAVVSTTIGVVTLVRF
ncbi:MAG TPA: tetratricopeptide repeat protein [Kofleriaceae bacterium]|nr:tetratricopeptide repeat protein [Kofleriaceae bacterium]